MNGAGNSHKVFVLQRNEKHQGSHDIVHVKDKTGQSWATRGVSPFPLYPPLSLHFPYHSLFTSLSFFVVIFLFYSPP